MKIIILPISGGAFVNQLAVLTLLAKLDYKPDVALCSSGGCVANHIAMAAEWTVPGIERISREVNSSMFAQVWNDWAIINFIQAWRKGAFYDKGIGTLDFFRRNFTREVVTNYEVWIGTQNVTTQRASLFCNRGSSALKMEKLNEAMHSVEAPIYCDGDLDVLSKACVASASVPPFVPEQEIHGQRYIDGGICGASPLTVLHEVLSESVSDLDSVHLNYIHAYNLLVPDVADAGDIMCNSKRVTRDILRSQAVVDRNFAYKIIEGICEKRRLKLKRKQIVLQNLQDVEVLENYFTRPYTFCEFYVENPKVLDITNFQGEKVVENMKLASEKIIVIIYYSTK